jgi:hypothetical protein
MAAPIREDSVCANSGGASCSRAGVVEHPAMHSTQYTPWAITDTAASADLPLVQANPECGWIASVQHRQGTVQG